MSNPKTTAKFYRDMYAKTSYQEGIDAARVDDHTRVVKHWLKTLRVGPRATVLEVGAGHGDLHGVHPNWRGIEYSAVAMQQGMKKYGKKLKITEGDATKLEVKTGTVDFLFSFATLEHIPEVEKAMREIMRVLKPGGVAVLAPAWNCRPWTVEKLQQRPYGELTLRQKVGKALIPLRENLLYRLLLAMPGRLLREARMLLGLPVALDYQALYPQWELFKTYPHISDDDAFVNMDAHAAIAYLRAHGFTIVSHPTFVARVACRAQPVVVHKP